MKFLLITYYFGNTPDVGAQRWTKNSKYIQKNGWEPVVFTFNQKDKFDSEFEVINHKTLEPNTIYSSLFKKKVPSDILTSKKTNFWNKLLVLIRSNLFIPDSRILTTISSKKILRKRLVKGDIDLIVSSGPPHSMHLIAKSMSKEFNIPWIADFRDPWTGIEYFKNLPISSIATSIHKKLEKKVLSSCDCVITVSKSWANHLNDLGARKTEVIHNGYDPEDFKENNAKSTNFSIAHFGTYPKSRNHSKLWEAINELCKNESFKNNLDLHFYGFTYQGFKAELEKYNFSDKLELFSPLPHSEATKKMSDYRYLLLSLSDTELSEGRIPLKFYEYLATNRTVIAFGKKDTDLSKIINRLDCGYYINYGEEFKLKEILLNEFENKNTVQKGNTSVISEFSKVEQAKQYSSLFSKTVKDYSSKKNL